MVLGILECDVLREDLQGDYHSYGKMFENLFSPLSPSLKCKVFSVLKDQYPEDIDSCDAYLITGSKQSVYDKDHWIKSLQLFIKKLFKKKKKLVGICFGHQLIAHTLGGKTEKSSKGWAIGLHHYDTTVEGKKLFTQNLIENFSLLVSHQDQVSQIPSHGTLLATSEFCPVAAFRINDHILCFQGHPEFTPEYTKRLIEKRGHIIPHSILLKGIHSLQKNSDSKLIALEILKFIT